MSVSKKNKSTQILTGKAALKYQKKIDELWRNDIGNGEYCPSLDILAPIIGEKTEAYLATFIVRFVMHQQGKFLKVDVLPYSKCQITQSLSEEEVERIRDFLIYRAFLLIEQIWPPQSTMPTLH